MVWLPLWAHVGGLLVLSVAIAVGMGALLWWALGPPRLEPLPTAPGAAAWTVANTFDAMKIVLSVVAGVGAVVALTVAYRKQDQGEAAEHREDTKLYNERFGKAADQLGSDKAAVRLAGVHALAGLADDWREGRQTCIDVLCAYIRMPWPELPPPQEPAEAESPQPEDGTVAASVVTAREIAEERQVRHTIIRVIRDHLRPGKRGDVERWHGHQFDFAGAEFHGGNLSGIDIANGTTLDFDGTTLSGGSVNFHGATFSSGAVTFREATFSGGTVTFREATFSGGAVTFREATFSGGTVTFHGATFSGGTVDFHDATFSGGAALFREATFSGGAVDLHDATFSGGTVTFYEATFSGGTVDFHGATFSGGTVDFPYALFTGGTVDFRYARFSAGTVTFYEATFSDGTVDFHGATFSGGTVDFPYALFTGGTVHFHRATFSGGTVDFELVDEWSVPPIGLPTDSAAVRLGSQSGRAGEVAS
ncbi:pentapeptide repeat-containing protein [Micromonospora sp. NBC_00389]|uniref:pentapeptide repeat-containing protein n=1 Tax=Micromonospora sp. NBC_00389 TaxID=2903586 RepID=UPI002E1F2D1B